MELTPKKELTIKLFCIFVIIILDLAIYLNGRDLDCDYCSVNFESKRVPKDSASYQTEQKFNVSIIKLYEGYLENRCIVEFDKDNGYYLKDDKQIE